MTQMKKAAMEAEMASLKRSLQKSEARGDEHYRNGAEWRKKCGELEGRIEGLRERNRHLTIEVEQARGWMSNALGLTATGCPKPFPEDSTT